MSYSCQNCMRRTPMKEIEARAKGWIVWTGTTMGGEQTTRIYCPVCCGRTEADEPGWDAECRTCDARMSDESWDDEDGPYSEEDARNWKSDHQCEPDVALITPEQIEQQQRQHAERVARMAVKS